MLSVSTLDDKVLADIEWFDGTEKSKIVLVGVHSHTRLPSTCATRRHTHNTRVHFSSSPLPYHLLGAGASKWAVLDDSTCVITYLGKGNAVKLFSGVSCMYEVFVCVLMCEFPRSTDSAFTSNARDAAPRALRF